ncbi:MAG: hypothetical protein ACUVQN_05770 [Caldisericia bacterium]
MEKEVIKKELGILDKFQPLFLLITIIFGLLIAKILFENPYIVVKMILPRLVFFFAIFVLTTIVAYVIGPSIELTILVLILNFLKVLKNIKFLGGN